GPRDLARGPLRLRPRVALRRAGHRDGGGPRAVRGRPRHLRQLRGARPRARARLALRPPVAHRRRTRRARRGRSATRPHRRHGPRRRRSSPLRDADRQHLRGSDRVVGCEMGRRSRRAQPESATDRAVTPRLRGALRRRLLAWYRANRRDLPWRRTREPYAIWISEAMLQQTRVETVIPYWQRFLARFPDVEALATAGVDDVTALWA